ncbi:MAG TPA: hypothetical protein VNH11_32720 [Pirellulales bacterium]|nr:hypothetical protein [Pirellulales bacterium]
MPDPVECLLATLAAAGASAVLVVALGWLRWANPAWMNAACVVAVGLGTAIGWAVLDLRPQWPPANALDRLLTIVLPAATVVELLAVLPRLPTGLAGLLRIGLALATARVLLHGSVYLGGAADAWRTTWPAAIWLVLAGGGLTCVWTMLFLFDQRHTGVSLPLALSQAIVCGGLAVMLAGYIRGGEAALPLAAAVTGAAVASAAISRLFAAHGLIGMGLIALAGVLLIGHFFGRLSATPAIVVFLAPLLCWVTELPPLRGRKPWQAVAIRLLLVALPLIAVLLLAKHDFDRDMAPLLGNLLE